MVRRLLHLLLVVTTLQLSWNVVTAYCLHETGRAANHFGHHTHLASPDELSLAAKAEQPSADPHPAEPHSGKPHAVKALAMHDGHCTSHAQLSLATPALAASSMPVEIVASAVADASVSPASVFLSPPERPQWTGRA